MTEISRMQAPVQAKPMPRNFMQEIVGRHWMPDADQRTPETDLPAAAHATRKSRSKKTPDLCLRQLTTFAVRSRG